MGFSVRVRLTSNGLTQLEGPYKNKCNLDLIEDPERRAFNEKSNLLINCK